MIFSPESGRELKNTPYAYDFTTFYKKLNFMDPVAYSKLYTWLGEMIDKGVAEGIKGKVNSSKWIPDTVKSWENKHFYPVYLACDKNGVLAEQMLRILIFMVFVDRTDAWSFDAGNFESILSKSITYSLVQPKSGRIN
jgi:hypothetical protein